MQYPDNQLRSRNDLAQVTRRAGIPEQAEQLDKTVANLANQIETLQAVLTPFLRPPPPVDPATGGPPGPCASPVENQLSGAISRIEYLSSELLDIRNRLAV